MDGCWVRKGLRVAHPWADFRGWWWWGGLVQGRLSNSGKHLVRWCFQVPYGSQMWLHHPGGPCLLCWGVIGCYPLKVWAPQGWWFKSNLRQQCGSGHGMWMEARRLLQISRRESWSESLLRQGVGCKGRKWVHENPSGGLSLESLSCSIPSVPFLVGAFVSLLWLCCVRAWAHLSLLSSAQKHTPALQPALWARAEHGRGRKKKGRERGQGLA